MDDDGRLATTLVLGILALALGGLLMLVSYALAASYGSVADRDLVAMSVVPITTATGAALVRGPDVRGFVVLAVFAVAMGGGLIGSSHLGARAWKQAHATADAAYACSADAAAPEHATRPGTWSDDGPVGPVDRPIVCGR